MCRKCRTGNPNARWSLGRARPHRAGKSCGGRRRSRESGVSFAAVKAARRAAPATEKRRTLVSTFRFLRKSESNDTVRAGLVPKETTAGGSHHHVLLSVFALIGDGCGVRSSINL